MSRAGALLVVALSVLVGACGDSSTAPSTPDPAAEAAFPVTVQDASRAVTLARRPERIVSLSPSATETLFAVGAGKQVVAVDEESDYPAGVPQTDLSSYQPNLEAIAAYQPDLVIVPAIAPRDVIKGLRGLGLTVFAEAAPERLDDAYERMRDIGIATGHGEAGSRLARKARAEIERVIAAVPRGRSLKVFHELDPDLYTASSDTFIGRIYERLGLANVADPAAKRTGSTYPQMSSEGVVSADPDLVVLADAECCGQTLAKLRQRPGWDVVAAIRRGAVVELDEAVASRWGPRVPELVERLTDAVATARGAPGDAE